MEKLVNYTLEMITAVWSDGYAPSFPECGYTEFWVEGTDETERKVVAISCPFRLDIFDKETGELIKMRFDDPVQKENYETHRKVWEETCKPYASAIVAAFAALKG